MDVTKNNYPVAGDWPETKATDLGFDVSKLQDALIQAETEEIDAPFDLTEMLPKGDRHPNDRPLGPLKRRGTTSGLVIRKGSRVGSFGPVESPEVTFSATKSYISAVAGLALDEGLISNLDDAVSDKISDGGFDSPQNESITWRQLLQQTSEWEGELFGIPDWIDRGREVGNSAKRTAETRTVGGSAAVSDNYRNLQAPGTFWEYNDVRVNRTALALLRLFNAPLPKILAEKIMTPIGASDSWVWHGYDTSWIELDGESVQSVSGGAHWGGGLWINSLDHARFGLLYLYGGIWNGQQILSKQWIEETRKPCKLNPDYGLMWWLNTNNNISELGSSTSFAARGAGGNIVFVEPELEIVIVLRWCGAIKKVIDSILACFD